MNLITQKNTGNTLWNDLLGSPGQAQVGGTAPNWTDEDFGLGGNTFKTLKFDTGDIAHFWFQTQQRTLV